MYIIIFRLMFARALPTNVDQIIFLH